jgi:endonuclease/exonuclease/phosphatase family metal-dependent hydrolase
MQALMGRMLILALAIGINFVDLRSETITIATYNVENYVAANRRVEGVYRPGYPKPEAEKKALRAVIRALDADVLVLQEMGPAAYLEELRRDLRSERCDYPYIVLAEAADADRHLAALSRKPFRRVQTTAGLDFGYFGAQEKVKRGLLEIALTVGDVELTLFAVHLRSRFTDRADDPGSAVYRAGEARVIRDFVLRRFPDPATAHFLILGDCNDTKASKPLRLLTKRGGTVISELLDATDSAGETWTYCFRKDDTYSRVDYIMESPGLARAAGSVGRIFDGPDVSAASDHRPVVLRLDLPGGTARK